MEPEKPGRIRGCLGIFANGANDFLLLMRVQFGRPTHLDAAIAGGGQAGPILPQFWTENF